MWVATRHRLLFSAVCLRAVLLGHCTLLRHTFRDMTKNQQIMTEHDAEDLLQRVYMHLHSDERSDDNFLGDKDDATFTKLYGDKALEAEGYGEITFQGLAGLLSDAGIRRGSFIDLGSGLGRSVIYACLAGGFAHCEGVELSQERSDRARRALAEVETTVPWIAEHVGLHTGDMLAIPEYFDCDAMLANNLLLPDEVQAGIADHFSHISRPGAVLFTTKELPLAPGVASMTKSAAAVTWKQGGKDFWFKYVKIL